MPRIKRVDVADLTYHVINRANARMQIFDNGEDYQLFENTLEEAKEKFDMRILAYCIMPNHWHLVLHTKKDGDLQKFIGWLSMTHTQRWHSHHKTIGSGHLYQGRYKSFPVETEGYLLILLKYVERNPLRAKLVKKAEDWKWSSLHRRAKGNQEQKDLLDRWPIAMPYNYLDQINSNSEDKRLEALRQCVNKSRPLGKENWCNQMIKRYDLGATLNNPGRPKKSS